MLLERYHAAARNTHNKNLICVLVAGHFEHILPRLFIRVGSRPVVVVRLGSRVLVLLLGRVVGPLTVLLLRGVLLIGVVLVVRVVRIAWYNKNPLQRLVLRQCVGEEKTFTLIGRSPRRRYARPRRKLKPPKRI